MRRLVLAVLCLLGASAGLATIQTESPDSQIEGLGTSYSMEPQVASAGDVNGDGYDDVLVVAPGYIDDGVPVWGSTIFVFHGSAAGIPDSTPDLAATQLVSDQLFGFYAASAAGAGDVNGDGFDDVIVGARNFESTGPSGQLRHGAAFVFLGGSAGIPSGGSDTAAGRLESNRMNANFGRSVGAPAFTPGGAAFLFLGEADADYYGGSGPVLDNCESRTNPRQTDADTDGHGNACDADLNQDGLTGGPDFGVWMRCMGKSVPATNGPPHDPTCRESDLNDDGVVGGSDFGLFIKEFGSPPGP